MKHKSMMLGLLPSLAFLQPPMSVLQPAQSLAMGEVNRPTKSYKTTPNRFRNCSNAREKARRRRQIEAGQLTEANGLVGSEA